MRVIEKKSVWNEFSVNCDKSLFLGVTEYQMSKKTGPICMRH